MSLAPEPEASPAPPAPSPPVARATREQPDIFGDVWAESVLYLLTLRAILVSPVTFHREWSTGRRRALNPFFFFFTSTAISFGSDFLKRRILGLPAWTLADRGGAVDRFLAHWTQSPLFDLAGPNLLVVQHLVTAVVLWAFLRKPGKPSLGITLGAMLYASAACVPFAVAVDAIQVLQHLGTGRTLAAGMFDLTDALIGFGYLVAAVVGVHEVRAWRAAKALIGTSMVLSFAVVIFFLITGRSLTVKPTDRSSFAASADFVRGARDGFNSASGKPTESSVAAPNKTTAPVIPIKPGAPATPAPAGTRP